MASAASSAPSRPRCPASASANICRSSRIASTRSRSCGASRTNTTRTIPYGVMTGFDGGQDQTDYFAKPTNHPSVPSVCQYFGVGRGQDLPGYVMLPAFPGYTQGLRRAGPYGGYLGPQFDPVFSTADAHVKDNDCRRQELLQPGHRRPSASRGCRSSTASSRSMHSTDGARLVTARRERRRQSTAGTTRPPRCRVRPAPLAEGEGRVRSVARAAQTPRTLRPRSLRCERAARAAARRGRRHLRHRSHRGEAQRPLGHAREQLQHAEGAPLAVPRPQPCPRCSMTCPTAGCSKRHW